MRSMVSHYFETKNVLPTREDGDSVMMFNTKEQKWEMVSVLSALFCKWLTVSSYSHWMQMPSAPSDTDVFVAA